MFCKTIRLFFVIAIMSARACTANIEVDPAAHNVPVEFVVRVEPEMAEFERAWRLGQATDLENKIATQALSETSRTRCQRVIAAARAGFDVSPILGLLLEDAALDNIPWASEETIAQNRAILAAIDVDLARIDGIIAAHANPTEYACAQAIIDAIDAREQARRACLEAIRAHLALHIEQAVPAQAENL